MFMDVGASIARPYRQYCDFAESQCEKACAYCRTATGRPYKLSRKIHKTPDA